MTDYPKITSVNVAIEPTLIQQAVANVMGQLIEAETTQKIYGEDACADRYGHKMEIPRAGKIPLGKSGKFEITLVIEPNESWAGSELQHDDVRGIAITGIAVDGQQVTK